MTRLLSALKVFDRARRTAQGARGALAGAARTQRRAQLLGFGLIAVTVSANASASAAATNSSAAP